MCPQVSDGVWARSSGVGFYQCSTDKTYRWVCPFAAAPASALAQRDQQKIRVWVQESDA